MVEKLVEIVGCGGRFRNVSLRFSARTILRTHFGQKQNNIGTPCKNKFLSINTMQLFYIWTVGVAERVCPYWLDNWRERQPWYPAASYAHEFQISQTPLRAFFSGSHRQKRPERDHKFIQNELPMTVSAFLTHAMQRTARFKLISGDASSLPPSRRPSFS